MAAARKRLPGNLAAPALSAAGRPQRKSGFEAEAARSPRVAASKVSLFEALGGKKLPRSRSGIDSIRAGDALNEQVRQRVAV